jgi:hypothetical protein
MHRPKSCKAKIFNVAIEAEHNFGNLEYFIDISTVASTMRAIKETSTYQCSKAWDEMAGPRHHGVLTLLDQKRHGVWVPEVCIDCRRVSIAQRREETKLSRPHPRLQCPPLWPLMENRHNPRQALAAIFP